MGLAVAPSRTPEIVLICCDVRISAGKKMENSNLDDIDNSDSNSETDNAATAKSSIALDHDTPKKKKAKRLSRFQTKWESDFDWCRRVPGNMFEANCTLCNRNFGIGHGGRNDLTIELMQLGVAI